MTPKTRGTLPKVHGALQARVVAERESATTARLREALHQAAEALERLQNRLQEREVRTMKADDVIRATDRLALAHAAGEHLALVRAQVQYHRARRALGYDP